MPNRRLPLYLAIVTATAVSGCGGSSEEAKNLESTTPPVEPRVFLSGDMSLDESLVADNAQGVYGYQPTTVLGDPEVVGSGVALISTTGRMIVATEDVVAFSRVEHNGASFTGDLVHVDFTKPDGVSQFSIFGKRDQESGADPLTNLVGTIENEDGGLEQTYRLVKQSEPAPIASIADIATTYRFTDEAGIVTVLTIDDQGGLSGTDTTGCTYSGQVYAPDSESHLIEAAYTASNCGSTTSVTGQQRDGSYNALGYFDAELYTLALFGASEDVVHRFAGEDINAPEPEPEPEPEPDIDADQFVSSDFTVESSVVARLSVGVFGYEDLPIEVTGGSEPLETGKAFVSSTGRVFAATPKRRFFSRGVVNETNTFIDDVTQTQVSIDTQIDPVSVIRMIPGDDSGTPVLFGSLEDAEGNLRVRYKLSPDETASLPDGGLLEFSALSGTYVETAAGGINTEFTIDSEGALTGSDTTGCVFLGQAHIPDPAINLIEARFDAANCGASPEASAAERNQTFNAIGTVSSGTLTLFMAGETDLTAEFEGALSGI